MNVHHKPQITRHLAAETDTLALGAALARGLRAGMVVYLTGELGAGKTTLARGMLSAVGVAERVKSPSFALVEPYIISKLYLYHFDFYRIKSSDEWSDAGLRECFNTDSVCLVEWPEKAGARLPAPDLTIDLAIEGSGRRAALSAATEAGRRCIQELEH